MNLINLSEDILIYILSNFLDYIDFDNFLELFKKIDSKSLSVLFNLLKSDKFIFNPLVILNNYNKPNNIMLFNIKINNLTININNIPQIILYDFIKNIKIVNIIIENNNSHFINFLIVDEFIKYYNINIAKIFYICRNINHINLYRSSGLKLGEMEKDAFSLVNIKPSLLKLFNKNMQNYCSFLKLFYEFTKEEIKDFLSLVNILKIKTKLKNMIPNEENIKKLYMLKDYLRFFSKNSNLLKTSLYHYDQNNYFYIQCKFCSERRSLPHKIKCEKYYCKTVILCASCSFM